MNTDTKQTGAMSTSTAATVRDQRSRQKKHAAIERWLRRPLAAPPTTRWFGL